MKKIFILSIIIFFLYGCSSLKQKEVIIVEKEVLIEKKVYNSIVCKHYLTTIGGEKLRTDYVLSVGAEFFEIYSCEALKDDDLFIKRDSPYFKTEFITVKVDNKNITPNYRIEPHSGSIDISFRMKKNNKAIIKLKNKIIGVIVIKF